MGLGGVSVWQLIIVLLIVALIFGTKRLGGLGGDVGEAIKGFKKAIKDDSSEKSEESVKEDSKVTSDEK